LDLDVLISNLGGATTLSATGAPGTYYVRVRGINAAGTGPASNEAVVILGGCATPATPVGLDLRNAGAAVTFSWSPTAGATSYVVRAGTSPGDSSLFNGNVGAATTVAGTLAPALIS